MSEERNQAIGKNIKKVLQANGVKQKDLATELGVSASAMSAYTTGKTSVPAWLIADIAERFHVSTDSLLESGSQFDENSSENYSAKTVFDCLLTLLIAFTGNLEIVKVPVNKTRFVDDRFAKKEEEFNALLIKDDYIDWILQRWELYLRVVDEAIDSMWELRQALVIDFVKQVLMDEEPVLRAAHLIQEKYNVLFDASGKKSEEKKLRTIFAECVAVPNRKLECFLTDYKDGEGNEIGKQNREVVRFDFDRALDEEWLSKWVQNKVFLKRFLVTVYSMDRYELLQHSITLNAWWLHGSTPILVIVELENMPPALGGFSTKRGENQYLICIAANLPDLERERVFLHELSHLLLGHLESDKPVDVLEREAEERAASLFELWTSGGQAPELELLDEYNEKREQISPLRV